MNDPNSFGYQDMPGGAAAGTPAPGATPNMAQYKFSSDEMRVLQECNRESFFQRSLPLSTALGLAAGAAVQQGYLKPNPRFGAFPKVTLAVIVGYFLGKLSYQQACADKLMSLPGSYIGQLLRDRRDGKLDRSVMGGRATVPAPGMLGAAPGDIYSDAGPGSALHLDSDRAGHVFSEDLSRPDTTGASEETPERAARPSLSYDELRRRNRGDHADAKQDPYRVEGPTTPVVRRAPTSSRPAGGGAAPPTNAYGDVLE